MTILGLTGDTANSWALQDTLHALALLDHGNLSCIPVALGESYVRRSYYVREVLQLMLRPAPHHDRTAF